MVVRNRHDPSCYIFGDRVATVSNDKTCRVWDIDGMFTNFVLVHMCISISFVCKCTDLVGD